MYSVRATPAPRPALTSHSVPPWDSHPQPEFKLPSPHYPTCSLPRKCGLSLAFHWSRTREPCCLLGLVSPMISTQWGNGHLFKNCPGSITVTTEICPGPMTELVREDRGEREGSHFGECCHLLSTFLKSSRKQFHC